MNPFGHNTDVPLAGSTNEREASPPPRFWTQVPQDEYTFGFTPELTMQQQEIGMSAPPRDARSSFPPPDATTSLNAAPEITDQSIDPLLLTPTLHSLDSPSNPSAVPAPAVLNPINPFANPIPAPPKEFHLVLNSAIHAQTPTPASLSSCLPPLAIPKAITDKIMNQATRITELEARMKTLQVQFGQLKVTADEYLDAQIAVNRDIVDMENELQEADRRATAIEDKLGRHRDLITELFNLVKTGVSRDKEEEDVKPKKKGKKSGGRDNALSTATQRCLYIAMGLPATSKLKDMAGKGQLLRPDWRVGFANNVSWHTPMVILLRNKTPSILPALTKEIMAKKSNDVLLERLEEDDEEEGDNGDDKGAVDENQLNRRSGRKVRNAWRPLKTAISTIDKDWDWFFQPVYQSTNESDDGNVIDPDTDTEAKDEPPARSTRKPWVTHAPEYRSQRLQNGVEFIDIALMERRRQFAKNNHGKTLAHDRIRGERKNKSLPFIKGDKAKIKRTAIDPTWLANNPNQDTPSRIEESDNETAGRVKVPAIVDEESSDSDSSNS
ncbi:hypothetical protein C8F04DRAFT_1277632 [Mycena alexandri]|uniref:Uncharacterized protein n=1 Tax=Mycena alexandri TaxID=1745969 RepID=A0AAD6WP47_9AGAR|nr:hypothetical protein C8F04DRAFT_1277632 [Mycena alexandri]